MEHIPWEIAETADALRRNLSRRASTLGVTRAQWRVLGRLYIEPNLRQVELADRLDMEPITLCRIVDRLEESKLMERRPDPQDRRAWRLVLTERSKPVIESLTELSHAMAAEALAGFDPCELELLSGMLKRIRANLVDREGASKAVGT